MIDLGKSRALVRTGATVMLTLSMTAGSLPLNAIAAYARDAVSISTAAITVNKDGFALEQGKEYSVPVALKKADGSASMAAGYFENTATLVWDDSSYSLRFQVKEGGRQFITSIKDASDLGNGVYQIKVDTVTSPVAVGFSLNTPIGAMDQTANLHIDTTALPTQAPATVDTSKLAAALNAAKAIAQGTKTDEAWNTLQQAISAAQAVLDKGDVTQEEVDAAIPVLGRAMAAFNASADKDDSSDAGDADTTAQQLDLHVYFKGAESAQFAKQLGEKAQVTKRDDGKYDVVLNVPSLGSMATLGNITYQGKKVAKAQNADGSAVYSFTVDTLDETLDITFGYTITAMNRTNLHPFQVALGDAQADVSTVDKTALTSAIVTAEAVEQGDKPDSSFTALQDAIAQAYATVDNHGTTADQVSRGVETLNKAVETFKAAGEDDADEPEQPGEDVKLEVGREYTVDVKLQKQDGSESMAAGYFEKTATVVYDGTSYAVSFNVTAEGAEYIKSIKGADATVEDLGDGAYRATVKSLDARIALTFGLSTPVGEMSQTGYLWIDTASLGLKPQQPGTTEGGSGNGGSDDNGSSSTEENATATASFEVGHTYQVPIAFKKSGSSETSMAAQYFGDTALVRPQANGTYTVSFSTNKAEWISGLTFKGATVARSGSQYAVTIPATTADTVLTLGLTIAPMGDKAVNCDMHLYLSQAKDLGTGQDNLTASSAKVLPSTGDTALAGSVAVASLGLAAIAGAEMLRRRGTRA